MGPAGTRQQESAGADEHGKAWSSGFNSVTPTYQLRVQRRVASHLWACVLLCKVGTIIPTIVGHSESLSEQALP